MSHPVWPCTPEFPLRAESGLGQATSRLAEFSAKRGFRRRHCAGPARSDCFLVRQAVRQGGCEEPGKESCYGGHRVRGVRSHRIALVPTAAQEVLLRPQQQAVFGVRSYRGGTTVVHPGVEMRVWRMARPGMLTRRGICAAMHWIGRVAPESTPAERKALALVLRPA